MCPCLRPLARRAHRAVVAVLPGEPSGRGRWAPAACRRDRLRMLARLEPGPTTAPPVVPVARLPAQTRPMAPLGFDDPAMAAVSRPLEVRPERAVGRPRRQVRVLAHRAARPAPAARAPRLLGRLHPLRAPRGPVLLFAPEVHAIPRASADRRQAALHVVVQPHGPLVSRVARPLVGRPLVGRPLVGRCGTGRRAPRATPVRDRAETRSAGPVGRATAGAVGRARASLIARRVRLALGPLAPTVTPVQPVAGRLVRLVELTTLEGNVRAVPARPMAGRLLGAAAAAGHGVVPAGRRGAVPPQDRALEPRLRARVRPARRVVR